MIKNYTSISLKIFLYVFLLAIFHNEINAQCFKIKSILVDACGSPEGENEMVRFDVGPNALNLADLAIVWPNNPFQNICQNAGTAAKTDTLNITITGCGHLTEPVGGVLPANSKVLIVTSTNFSTTFNSFANLTDSLIIIYQCAGNTSGHFANYSSTPGLRTLQMSFANPPGCIDSATYDRSLLVNQGGTTGGSSTYNDGAFVSFDAAGVPTYLNYGCQSLGTTLYASAGPDIIDCNPGSLTFNGTVSGTFTSVQWSGGTGSFSNANALTTTYTPGSGESGWIAFSFTVTGSCSITSTSYLHVYIPNVTPAPILSAVGSTIYCSLASATFTYAWTLNGSPEPGNFYIHTAGANGCYQVTVTDNSGCSVVSDTICFTNAGMNEINDADEITVNPNPANDFITVNINYYYIGKDAMIFNVEGELIAKQKLVKKHQDINTSAFSNGIYYLKIGAISHPVKFSIMK